MSYSTSVAAHFFIAFRFDNNYKPIINWDGFELQLSILLQMIEQTERVHDINFDLVEMAEQMRRISSNHFFEK